MFNNLIPWSPPESKTMQKVVKYGLLGALAVAGVTAFTVFAPTLVAALTLVNLIFTSGTSMLISGLGFVGVLFFARELLSPNGSINKLIRLPYWALVNGLTKFFIVIDPLSPITTRINSVRADQAIFEVQFEKLDGLISTLHAKAARYREQSAKAQRFGAAAAAKGATGAQDVAAHQFGSYREIADQYDATVARLEPARATFQRIAQAANVTAQKLEIERDIRRDQWETQKAVSAAVGSAGRILGRSKTQVWSDAQQAEQIIDDKYGEELGHLDHLKQFAEPFLQSIDVENASYSEEMLQRVQTAGAKLVQSTAATPLPLPAPAQGEDSLAGFLR